MIFKRLFLPSEKIVIWFILLCLLEAQYFYQKYLGPGPDESYSTEIGLFLIGMYLIPAFCSMAIRWFVIPRQRTYAMAVVMSVIGMAIGEAITFFGCFLFQQYFTLFFWTSILMVLQYIPLYTLTSRP